MGVFTRNVVMTLSFRVTGLLIGLGNAVIIARFLGPEGNGVYSLTILIPSLVIVFANLGIGRATVYYVAGKHYSYQEIFGSSVWFSLGMGFWSLIIGLIFVLFLQETLLPSIPQRYSLLALLLIPVTIFVGNLQNIFLGLQRFLEFNLASIGQATLNLVLVSAALWGLQTGIPGAIGARVLTFLILAIGLFFSIQLVLGRVSWQPNLVYMKAAATYGAQTYISNVLAFLNYRLDLFLVNGFLGPAAVGFYAIAVGMAERISIVSQVAGTVLYPRVAAESNEQARKVFTPIVCRNVLWLTAAVAGVLYGLSSWLVVLLYSTEYQPAVRPFQILLLGIVAFSPSLVLANDISGRGKPLLNSYLAGMSLAINVSLNIFLIPRYGIDGAAWATTFSHSITLIARIFVYSRLSGNLPLTVLLPQHSDWELWWRVASPARWLKRGLGRRR